MNRLMLALSLVAVGCSKPDQRLLPGEYASEWIGKATDCRGVARLKKSWILTEMAPVAIGYSVVDEDWNVWTGTGIALGAWSKDYLVCRDKPLTKRYGFIEQDGIKTYYTCDADNECQKVRQNIFKLKW